MSGDEKRKTLSIKGIPLESFSERMTIVSELAAGNGEPLARHLAANGELYDDQREVLIKYLRGELKLRRGNRRTYAGEMKANAIRERLQMLRVHFAMVYGSRGSYRRALDAHLELDPSVGMDTLIKYAKEGLTPKSKLDMIDQIRAEILAENPEWGIQSP